MDTKVMADTGNEAHNGFGFRIDGYIVDHTLIQLEHVKVNLRQKEEVTKSNHET